MDMIHNKSTIAQAIEQRNAEIEALRPVANTGDKNAIAKATTLEIANYMDYLRMYHAFLEGHTRQGYSAAYFGAYNDTLVAECMPVEWKYFDKDPRYKTKQPKGNVVFAWADLTRGVPEQLTPESLDVVLAKNITFKDLPLGLLTQFPIWQSLRQGGVAVVDSRQFASDPRFATLTELDDVSLVPFSSIRQGPDGIYYNPKKLFAYRKL